MVICGVSAHSKPWHKPYQLLGSPVPHTSSEKSTEEIDTLIKLSLNFNSQEQVFLMKVHRESVTKLCNGLLAFSESASFS